MSTMRRESFFHNLKKKFSNMTTEEKPTFDSKYEKLFASFSSLTASVEAFKGHVAAYTQSIIKLAQAGSNYILS